MTRILVQRGSAGGSSSNQSRPSSSSLSGSSSARAEPQVTAPQVLPTFKDEEIVDEGPEHVAVDELLENYGSSDNKAVKNDEVSLMSFHGDRNEGSSNENGSSMKVCCDDSMGSEELLKGLDGLRISEIDRVTCENEGSSGDCSLMVSGSSPSNPPPPPIPPPIPAGANSGLRRLSTGTSNAVRTGSTRRAVAWPVVLTRTSPTESRPSSPRTHGDSEGYNSADEQNPHLVSSYDDIERERQFEIDIRRAKSLEVKRMLEDGNCLFRAVGDQVYGDSDAYDLIRQMCIDYMERERDHFSQFITEGFTSYCKRKRRDKVYGNNVEIQALSEMYNRPIHIYSYSTEPINIFHGSYNTDTPPIRLSFHHGNHYNSLVDPRRATIGAGLGFSCLRGTNVDKDQIKAAIKAQQDQQIDNALVAEGRLYSDLELTEKEIERMVMEASRAEYLADDKFKQQLGHRESSSSKAEPSSSGATGSETSSRVEDTALSSSMQMVLSMGFSYLQVIEAYSIFGDDVDSMVCYLLETSNRRKGKATE